MNSIGLDGFSRGFLNSIPANKVVHASDRIQYLLLGVLYVVVVVYPLFLHPIHIYY